MIIQTTWNPKNKFCVARVHYSCDPEKSTPEWKAKAREGLSDRGWNREYEITYDVYAGLPVYSDFKRGVHVKAFDVPANATLYRGWDFGYNHPAMVVVYINEFDQFCVKDEILGEHEGIKEFGLRAKRHCQLKFPGASWLDACDDAGKQVNDKSNETSIQVLNNDPINIYPVFRASGINEGLEIIRQRLLIRNDGKPGFIIHPDCKILIDSFMGGYRYPEKKEGTPEDEKPLKDGYYEHLCDALRELAINYLEMAQTSNNRIDSMGNNEIMRNTGDVTEYLT
jgi:hypothetical protein